MPDWEQGVASMIERAVTPHLLEQAGHFPVVTLLGPRQSGKTTLARHAFPDYRYATLERGDLRELAERDPAAFSAFRRSCRPRNVMISTETARYAESRIASI